MIIIWQGAGGVVILIPILVCLVTNIITSGVFEENNYFQAHLWPKLTALGVTGMFCWFLGRYLNTRPPRMVLDQKTGEKVQEKPYHHFMFLKMEYWGVIFAGTGVVLLVVSLIR
jgi:hypothetical protein